ncbi:MAG TPA: hypothetical protein VF742_09145 [Terracidiphilus sp.]
MTNRASAVESISPALTRTKQMLFHPFRFGLWARLAVVALITGEAGGAGTGGGSIPNFNPNRGQGGNNHWARASHLFSVPGWEQIQPYIGWIVVGVVLALAVMFLWIYSDCVYRFILLDAVVSDQCRLRQGWRRWRAAGRRYFLWVIAFGIGAFAVVGLVAGVPVLLAYRAGWFEHPEQNLGALIGGGILLALLVIALVAMLAVIDMLGRDFLVPVMAFGEVGALEGWERLLAMMGAEKSAYAVYVLMKIVLAMAAAIIFAIINLIVILVLLIPLGLLALAGYLIGSGLGMTWDISTELLVAAVGMLAIAAILYIVGFVYAPGLVFLQSYTVEFFAPRYAPLGSKMFPPRAPAPP